MGGGRLTLCQGPPAFIPDIEKIHKFRGSLIFRLDHLGRLFYTPGPKKN
jgi:hypothetical protein